jgi:hypothetical protein
MTIRTFKLYGQAYKSALPVTIVAKIDGVEVFNGLASTTTPWRPAQLMALPSYSSGVYESVGSVTIPSGGYELFSFTAPVEFAGTKTMEISVTGAPLQLTFLLANYRPDMPGPDNVANNNPIIGSENYYCDFYYNTIDGVLISDPISDVAINDVLRAPIRDAATQEGNWMWVVPNESTLTCTINIMAGSVAV